MLRTDAFQRGSMHTGTFKNYYIAGRARFRLQVRSIFPRVIIWRRNMSPTKTIASPLQGCCCGFNQGEVLEQAIRSRHTRWLVFSICPYHTRRIPYGRDILRCTKWCHINNAFEQTRSRGLQTTQIFHVVYTIAYLGFWSRFRFSNLAPTVEGAVSVFVCIAIHSELVHFRRRLTHELRASVIVDEYLKALMNNLELHERQRIENNCVVHIVRVF